MNETYQVVGMDDVNGENAEIEALESEVVNLIGVGIDQSWSMTDYTNPMIQCLQDFKQALEDSKEADEILVSRINFNNSQVQVEGYQRIGEFQHHYEANGNTPLYDAVVRGADELLHYMKQLKDNGMRPKAVFGIFSDGQDVGSTNDFRKAKEKMNVLNQNEIVTAFISFGEEAKIEAKRLGFRNILEVGRSHSELRKAFNVFSKSVIENSKSVVQNADQFYI